MGAIFGVLARDRAAAESMCIAALEHALAHRGSDVSGCWSGEGASLGIRLFHTTPESLLETPPRVAGGQELVIAGDCRIDNREELYRLLGDLVEVPCADSALVLAAYERWGGDCVDHLIGDFAFAIFDPGKHELFCARDHFGAKPFCYTRQDDCFAFASEAKALVSAGLAPDEVDEARIADFLLMQLDDKERTFHRHVRRLPPAHVMVVRHDGVEMRRYWRPVADGSGAHLSDEDAATRFRALFEQAVACRLRSVHPVGSFLSGGLDSSAVTVVASRLLASSALPLDTFSAVFPEETRSDESAWMTLVEQQAQAEGRPLRRHLFQGDSTGPLEVIDEITRCLGAPSSAANLYQPWQMLRMARDAGVRVMLGGHDGDTVVSHGFAVLTELAVAGRWDDADRQLAEIGTLLGNYEGVRKSLARTYLRTVPGHLWRAGHYLRALRALEQVFRRYGGSRKTMLLELLGRRKPQAHRGLASVSFAGSAVFRARQAAPRAQMGASAAEDHVRGIDSGLMAYAFEDIECVSSAFGIESRHPFFDKRLVEFCLSLPARQKIRDGWTRVVQREAMRGVLPEPLRTRPDKSNLGHNFNASLKHGGARMDQALATLAGMAGEDKQGGYVDAAMLEKVLARYRQVPKANDALLLYLAAGFAAWIRPSPKVSPPSP
ncbi:MAG: lasso peptide isopeptide bond-forming cyclase [Thermomonas sp.]|nr:lasso peptide isopeptide bond-forming cyclase [Thermomonas sp.]